METQVFLANNLRKGSLWRSVQSHVQTKPQHGCRRKVCAVLNGKRRISQHLDQGNLTPERTQQPLHCQVTIRPKLRLLDVVIEQKQLYLVFEFLNTDLKGYIEGLKDKKESMDPLRLKKLLFSLVSGVAKIHQKRIVHRDLKPPNILLDKDRTWLHQFS